MFYVFIWIFLMTLQTVFTESVSNTQQVPKRNNTFSWGWMAQALGDVLFKSK